MGNANFVALRHCKANPCYLEVVAANTIPRLRISPDGRTCRLGNSGDVSIGNPICSDGVISVYDRRDTAQLNRMVHDATEIVRSDMPCDD